MCGVCEEPVPDAGSICHGDARRLALMLRDVPALARELDVTVTRRAKVAHRAGPARAVELDPVRVDFDVRASAALDHLGGMLRGWAVNLAEDIDRNAPPGGRNVVAGYALWIAARIGDVRLRPWAPDMFAEVTDAVREATRAIDAPPDLAFMGHCPGAYDTGEGCTAELWAPPGTPVGRCRECGTEVDFAELRAAYVADAAHVLAPAPVIARAFTSQGQALTVERVRQWRHRGLVAPVDRDPATGRDLFRLGDVAEVLARMDARTPPGVLGRRKGAHGAAGGA